MNRVVRIVPLAILCALIIAAPSVWAYWAQDGMAICMAGGDQWYPMAVADGAGGAIVTWWDYRNGNADIYAQKVNASGVIQWTTDGVALCTATGDQLNPTIVADNAGGAIITWHDQRSGNCDIYAQKVNAAGTVLWTTDGVALCTATADQWYPMVVADGAGGAIVTWEDLRSGYFKAYAQRVNASGVVQWTTDGVALCTATGDQANPMIAVDGAGGAIVTWRDYRLGNENWDIYAQRVSASGSVLWAATGAALCTATGNQLYPTIVADGAGGAIVTWADVRSGIYDIYAQKVNTSGAAQWMTDGVALCAATGHQQFPQITSDGASGAIVTWYDARNGNWGSPWNWDIYVQRVNASGVVQWITDGKALSTAIGDQVAPTIVSDGAGGAIVTWYDYRSEDDNIHVQKVNASGVVQWATDGVVLCAATGDQEFPQITSDGAGGAIVTWQDYRSGNNYDIHAQDIDAQGRAGFLGPSIHSVRDVPGDQGGKVYLSWHGSRSDVFMDGEVSYYSIWRAISPTEAMLELDGGTLSLDDLSTLKCSSEKRFIRIEQAIAGPFFWELLETVNAYYMDGYGKPVATLFDSTAACTEYSYFQVVAHTMAPEVFWKSDPDSGRSVDNLAPETPVFLTSWYAAGVTRVRWQPNAEPDLAQYRLYRGTSAEFVPVIDNLVTAQADTGYVDSGMSPFSWYKLVAVDLHGNESASATLSPQQIMGSPDGEVPTVTRLAWPVPNPFNPTTTIGFSLSRSGRVRIEVFDAVGRRIRTLVDEDRPVGRYEVRWDGTTDGGRDSASGVYFCRMETGSFHETRRMTLVK